jgi:hypothetical protein
MKHELISDYRVAKVVLLEFYATYQSIALEQLYTLVFGAKTIGRFVRPQKIHELRTNPLSLRPVPLSHPDSMDGEESTRRALFKQNSYANEADERPVKFNSFGEI